MKTKLSANVFKPKYDVIIHLATIYNAEKLFDIRRNNIIDYDVKLSNGKNLQRDFVWSIEQKRELIISMLKEIRLPNFAIVHYVDDSLPFDKQKVTYKIIDGKQRLKTIEEFINNKFGLLINGEEYFYDDLDQNAQFRIARYSLNFNIVYEYADTRLTDDELICWFELVNFAGTPQDLDHLEKLKS